MVSFLDTGLVGIFSVIFIFLLVYAIVWGVLVARKPFGDNKGLYAIISVGVAFLFVLSRPAMILLETLIPWYAALAIIFLMIIITISIFTEVEWTKVIKDETAKVWMIIIIVGVFVTGVAFTFGQAALEAGTGQAPQPVPAYNPETGEIVDVTSTSPGPRPSGSGMSPTGTPDFETNLITTITHPKVLGIALIFLISMMIIFFLSRPAGGL